MMSEWKTVPVEVTDAMRHAGFSAYINAESGVVVEATADAVWQAMLAAAPSPPAAGDGLVEQLQAAYDKVADFPERRPDGLLDLLALRNLVPEAAARITALETDNVQLNEAIRVQHLQAMQKVTALEGDNRELVEALRPFADYAGLPGFDRLHEDMAMTSGSRMAAKQVTVKEFRAARAALARATGGKHD